MTSNVDDVVAAAIRIGRILADIASGQITEALDHVEEAVRAAHLVGCATDAQLNASARCIDVAVLREMQECLNSKLPHPVAGRRRL